MTGCFTFITVFVKYCPTLILPSRASVFGAVFGELPVGDDVDAALVDNGDATEDLSHLCDLKKISTNSFYGNYTENLECFMSTKTIICNI